MRKLYEDIIVLDFTNNIAGPVCAAYFADFGADVIKIERPVYGDDTRHMAPKVKEGESIVSWYPNRGKRSITVDLDDSRGIEIINKMILTADVIVESFRPGIMEKYGLDYKNVSKLNPNIVYCSISAFGQTGPNAKKPGYDLIAQARSGIVEYNGYPNQPGLKISFVIGDFTGALFGAIGIAQALFYRERTGVGQYIDISLVDGLITYNNNVEVYSALGKEIIRSGNHFTQICPYGIFQGKNNQSIAICTSQEKQWVKLLEIMKRSELKNDPDLASVTERVSNLDKVIKIIEEWLILFDDIQDVVDILNEAGIPASKIFKGKDLAKEPDLIERGAVVDFEPPSNITSIKNMKARGNPIKMNVTPPVIKRPPSLGEHNNEVFDYYGFDSEYITKLQKEWTEKYSQ